jgi:hypothetical protein
VFDDVNGEDDDRYGTAGVAGDRTESMVVLPGDSTWCLPKLGVASFEPPFLA